MKFNFEKEYDSSLLLDVIKYNHDKYVSYINDLPLLLIKNMKKYFQHVTKKYHV